MMTDQEREIWNMAYVYRYLNGYHPSKAASCADDAIRGLRECRKQVPGTGVAVQ